MFSSENGFICGVFGSRKCPGTSGPDLAYWPLHLSLSLPINCHFLRYFKALVNSAVLSYYQVNIPDFRLTYITVFVQNESNKV